MTIRTSSAADAGEPAELPDAATLVEHYGIDRKLATQVAADLAARSDLGFPVDPQLVINLRSGTMPRAEEVPEIAMTTDEAEVFFVRQSLVEDAQVLNRRLSAGEFADVYAGQFVNNTGGGRLVVQVAGEKGAAAVREALDGGLGASLPHRDRIVVNSVTTSRRDLVAARESVMARVESEGSDTWVSSIEIDNSGNELVASVTPSATEDEVRRLRAWLTRLDVRFRLNERQPFELTAETLRSDSKTPPYSGGHGYVATNATSDPPPSSTKGWWCTLGFAVTRANDPGSYMLSAGHCWYDFINQTWEAPIDSKAYYNWNNQGGGTRTLLGSVKGYWVTESLDLSLLATVEALPKIIVHQPPDRGYRGITNVTAYAPQGTSLCAVGAMSNAPHCGTVADWTDDNGGIVANIPNVIKGDSGGPLYLIRPNLKAWATGITRSSNGSQTKSTNIYSSLHTFCGDCNVATE